MKRALVSFLSIAVLLIAAAISALLMFKRVDLPPHLLNHPIVYQKEFLPKETQEYLVDLIKKQAIFPTNAADTLFFEAVEHIGEAIPIGANGKCDHPFLVPNSKRTLCVIPGRVDVAKAFILSGGPLGFKEFYEKSISRLLTFGTYNFDLEKDAVISKLFKSEGFLNVARKVCPSDRQHLDPLQYNFIIATAGQSVAAHLDAPYFKHMNRFSMPQWLLVVSKFSGLFEDEFVPQNQIVSYLHNWEPTDEKGGKFIFWNDNSGTFQAESAWPRAASGVDGSTLVHAGDVYHPNYKNIKPLDKSTFVRLEYNAETNQSAEHWALKSNDNIVETFAHDDLRICIVYRARCFANEEDAAQYRKDLHDKTTWTPIDEVLTKLGGDLITRGVIDEAKLQFFLNGDDNTTKEAARLDFAMLLIKTYVKYPFAPVEASWFPFNYCALSIQFPWMRPLLEPICA